MSLARAYRHHKKQAVPNQHRQQIPVRDDLVSQCEGLHCHYRPRPYRPHRFQRLHRSRPNELHRLHQFLHSPPLRNLTPLLQGVPFLLVPNRWSRADAQLDGAHQTSDQLHDDHLGLQLVGPPALPSSPLLWKLLHSSCLFLRVLLFEDGGSLTNFDLLLWR